jgi:hypothetical protein
MGKRTVVCHSLEEDAALSEEEQALKLSLFLAEQHEQELVRHQHEQELNRHAQKQKGAEKLVLRRNHRYLEVQRSVMEVEKDLENLKQQIATLTSLHQHRRHCLFDEEEHTRVEEKLAKLKGLVAETFTHADKVARGLQAVPNDSIEIKQLYGNTRGALKRKITDCRRQFQQVRQGTSASYGPATQTADDFIAGRELTAEAQLQQIDQLLMSSEVAAHAEQDQEDIEVQKVIHDVRDMNQLFADFGELTHAQRSPTEKVATAIMETKARAEEGFQAIKRSAELQPKCSIM